ncbi:TonB system biopolymer transport component; Chromosome segregation ATPase [hydrothermal vent metagenome]|uniref:TonB system biopolymer transport component Chromosome segregation ATPase n=1 Tax=hydrothermal vent metagenome TaxID=652676 RepID=A0A3B0S3C7_9ZZZZ
MNRAAILGSTAVLLAMICAPAQAQFKSAINTSQQTQRDTAKSQQRIDQLDDQTATLLNDYRANLKQLEAARRYNASLNRNIDAQNSEIVRLREDIDNVEGLQRAMQPLMEDMVARFGDLVNADLPFMVGERAERAARLSTILDNPSMSAAQRYRLIVEAYQIENEYGRTIGYYVGTVGEGENALTGEFLRVGRIALMFKTPDDSELKIYDASAGDFVDLNRSYLQDVKFGLRMAKEQTAPDIFFVPVKPPVSAQ